MSCRRHRSAFSLLELVVVIGIVAIMGGMLVAGISRVRGRISDVSCQNNIRQILFGLNAYCMDNGESFPYGWYYKHSDPVTWEESPGGDGSFISWVTEINQYIGSRTNGISHLFQCPEALQVTPHANSYVMNFIVAISPHSELAAGEFPYAQTKPAPMKLMRIEGTALLWDTAIQPGWEGARSFGFLTGADIDGQRFWQGAMAPQFRYFSPNDPYAQFPPGTYGNNVAVRLNLGSIVYRNVDPPSGSSFPYQGNLRFRHNKNTACNAGFSDGSVRQFTAVLGNNNSVTSHNALRRYFMINWPSNTPANPNQPGAPAEPPIPPPHRNPLR